MQLKVLISFLIEWYIQENEQIVSAQFAGYLDETEKDVISISYPLSCYHLAVLSSERTACPDSWRHSLVSSVKETEWLVSTVFPSQQRSDFFFFFFFFLFISCWKKQTASWVWASFLWSGHADLLCIVPIAVYVSRSEHQRWDFWCPSDWIYLSNAGCTLIFWFFYI